MVKVCYTKSSRLLFASRPSFLTKIHILVYWAIVNHYGILMNLYLVRSPAHNGHQPTLLGMFAARCVKDLWSILDEEANPYLMEYAPISIGGGVWFNNIKEICVDSDGEEYNSVAEFDPSKVDGDDKALTRYPNIGGIAFDQTMDEIIESAFNQDRTDNPYLDVNDRLTKLSWRTFKRNIHVTKEDVWKACEYIESQKT